MLIFDYRGGVTTENIVRLHGEHINLCPMRSDPEAIALYTKWINDEEIAHFITRNDQVFSFEYEKDRALQRKNDRYYFNIVQFSNDRLIGNCSLGVSQRSGSLGILIGEPTARGNGYGTEAVKMLLKFGFEEVGLNSIHLQLLSTNERAHRCYLKAGLKDCGRKREARFYKGKYADVLLMDILAREYFSSLNNET